MVHFYLFKKASVFAVTLTLDEFFEMNFKLCDDLSFDLSAALEKHTQNYIEAYDSEIYCSDKDSDLRESAKQEFIEDLKSHFDKCDLCDDDYMIFEGI